jgi:hypothetical protein
VTENAIIPQFEKGKTVVIIHSNKYSNKLHTFLAANNFLLISKDPSKKLKKTHRENSDNAT